MAPGLHEIRIVQPIVASPSDPQTCILAVGLDAVGTQAGTARVPGRRHDRRRVRAGHGARLPLRPIRRMPRAPAVRCWRLVEVDEAAVDAVRREVEVRPSAPRPPRRPTPAARVVLLIATLVATSAVSAWIAQATAPSIAAILAGAALAGAGVFLCWLAGWIDREFLRQWRMAIWLGLPVAATWAWILWASGGRS